MTSRGCARAQLRHGVADRESAALALAEMRVIAKDRIRFAVAAAGARAEVEIRIRPDRCGGWQSSVLFRAPEAAAPEALGRTFRSPDRGIAAGKMVAWVRRRYLDAQPVAEGRSLVIAATTNQDRRTDHG
jgi:hypothetical protein